MAIGLPRLRVGSAGLAAVVGAGADDTATAVAAEAGIDLSGHIARQLTPKIARQFDLILTVEPSHRSEIGRLFPEMSGRTMLLDHWTGARGIADPFRRTEGFHREIRDQILAAAQAWIDRLGQNG